VRPAAQRDFARLERRLGLAEREVRAGLRGPLDQLEAAELVPSASGWEQET
jgi:hypothetical protein